MDDRSDVSGINEFNYHQRFRALAAKNTKYDGKKAVMVKFNILLIGRD